MSEDDTFRILTRPSYSEIYDIVWYRPFGIELNDILESYGWTREEFFKANRDFLVRNFTQLMIPKG